MTHQSIPTNVHRDPCHCCGGGGWMTSTQQCGVCEGTGQCGVHR
ncbi:UNVERIFIED_ORG: RecJ-like exonuclease [Microbispora rosea subsp. rosea]